MNSKSEHFYEKIGELVTREIPEEFTHLWVYFRKYECGSTDMAFYYQVQGNKRHVFSFSPSANIVFELDDTSTELRKFSKSKGSPWTIATFQLDAEGNFTMDYSYDNITDASLHELNEAWEKKYLGKLKIKARDHETKRPKRTKFQALLAQSFAELQSKTAAHDALWHFREIQIWEVDQDLGIIRFRRADNITATAPVQIIGTWNSMDKTWLWSWANSSILEPLQSYAKKVCSYGKEKNLEMLTKAKIGCDEDMAWKLTALAVKLNEAQGAYRGPAGSTAVFMAFGKVTLQKKKKK